MSTSERFPVPDTGGIVGGIPGLVGRGAFFDIIIVPFLYFGNHLVVGLQAFTPPISPILVLRTALPAATFH